VVEHVDPIDMQARRRMGVSGGGHGVWGTQGLRYFTLQGMPRPRRRATCAGVAPRVRTVLAAVPAVYIRLTGAVERRSTWTLSDEQTAAEFDLSALLERVARALSDSAERDNTKDEIVHQAVEEIPGVEVSSISVTSVHGLLTTVAVTDPLATQADILQARFAEGPCFDAGTTGVTQISSRVADDDRWPRYGLAAADLGVVAQMSVNIYVVGTSGMALNLYARQAAAFEHSRQTAELVASQAAIAIGFSDAATARKQAMVTRGVIGQAIGIIMQRYQLDDTRALAFLVRASHDGNIKLRDIAESLVKAHNAATRP
jgi:hypothetical protein